MKKWLPLFLILGGIGILLKFKAFRDAAEYETSCPFCSEAILSRQLIYETSNLYVLCSHKPILEGHCLIIPKRHIRTVLELTSDEWNGIHEAIGHLHQAVGKESFLILQKNGLEVGQSVPHVHFHYIPRDKGKTSSFPVLAKFFLSPLYPSLSQEKMEKVIASIQENLPAISSPS